MLNCVYKLKSPRLFEVSFEDISLDCDSVLVRPTHLSICNADQRYYQGTRSDSVLREKLPMALIHEGIGTVLVDNTHTYAIGDTVVMIPNIPQDKDDVVAENYLRTSHFRASSEDGFLQEYIKTTPDRIVKLPKNISKTVGAFTEIVSVSYHAIKRFDRIAHKRRDVIGVWGDGNLGYITALLLKKIFPKSQVYVFGVIEAKLCDFTFADKTFTVSGVSEDIKVDHAFECVGGAGSAKAINQIIDLINPEGTIAILGVSEELASINTRMILEKGLRLFGSSRSGREDYTELMALYHKSPDIATYLENIVGSQVHVRKLKDIQNAFETDIHKMIGKTIMLWDK